MWSDKIAEKRFYNLLRKRDKQAMELLYDHYSPVMYGLILHIIRNETAAENTLIKTFQYIWKNYKEFDPDKQHFSAWIINVTRKVCKKELSFREFIKNGNNAMFSGLDKSKLSLAGPPSSVKSKKVLDLIFFGNGSVAEVAEHAGMSEADIKYSLRDAIGQLKRISEKV